MSNTECEQLKVLERSNLQREQRIKRVRQKNFHQKEAELSAELSRRSSESLRKWTELEVARRQFVNDMSRKVFPIEVESLSERDDGEGERERERVCSVCAVGPKYSERMSCAYINCVSLHASILYPLHLKGNRQLRNTRTHM